MSRDLEMQGETCRVGRRRRAAGIGGAGLELWQWIHKKPRGIHTLVVIIPLEQMDLMLEAGRSIKEKGTQQMAGVEKKRRCEVGETGTGRGHKSIHIAILIPSSRSHGQKFSSIVGEAVEGIGKG